MKKNYFILLATVLISCTVSWSQTSYGNLNEGNAGDNGGSSNSYFGNHAGLINTGYGNTFLGANTGRNNTSGANNTFLGTASGYNNTTGIYNNFLGFNSGYHNLSGDGNVFIGHYSGFDNTEGNNNTFLGRASGADNTTGDNNVFSGFNSGRYNTMGNDNVAYGSQSLRNNTTSGKNVAIGARALYSQSYNNGNTTWDGNNVAVGYEALYSNQPTGGSVGRWNSAVGNQALRNNTTGWDNTATGYQALYFNTAGFRNTAHGTRTLYDNTLGISNTAIGSLALGNNTTGDFNTAIGVSALSSNITGNFNTALGYGAGPANNGFHNSTAIGSWSTTTASNQVRIGDVFVTSIGGYTPWTNLSDARFKKDIKEDIPGLEFITQLRTVSYDLDRTKLHTFLGKEATKEGNSAPSAYRRSIGFIAQEVEQIVKENEYPAIGVEAPQNDGDHYSIRYSEFVVPLVKAVQELSSENNEQKQHIESLQQEVNELKSLFYGDTKTGDTSARTSGTTDDISKSGFVLYQNTPNPFDKTTTISATVPDAVQQAKITIYNLNGTELASYDLKGRGKTSIALSAGSLPSGMYIYALIADDRVIDTKKMILTK